QEEPHRIGEVIDAVIERLRLRGRENLEGHPLDTLVEPGLPPAPMDAIEIDEVLTNLLENAVKYTPPGTPIHVRARCVTGQPGDGNAIEVEVSDEGPGIAPEYMANLFDRFYRVTSERNGAAGHSVQGTGLGLSIAKGIVEAH